MRTKKKQINRILFFAFCIFSLLTFLFFVKKILESKTYEKSENPVVLINSGGSQTNIILDKSENAIQISTASANHNEPFLRGDFIVWIEEQQNKSEKYVVRYHVPTKTTFYITTTGVSQNPKVNTQGQVVWQEWKNEVWQIFFFDGFQTTQITESQLSASNPDIAQDMIVYSQKNTTGIWQTIEYSLKTQKSRIVKEGIEAKNPYFYGTELFFR